jgi:hypothetical protein
MELNALQIRSIIDEIELYENTQRKAKEFKSFQIYDGNLKTYVSHRIREMYPKTFKAYTISDYSLLKKVTDKKAKAYKESPVRKTREQADQDNYTTIVRQNGLNQAMSKLDRYYNQHKYCLMGSFMELDEQGQASFRFMPLAPYEFDCVKDDKGNLKIVILSYPDPVITVGNGSDGMDTLIAGSKADEGAQVKIYAFWTDTNHYVVKFKKGTDGKSSGLPEFLPLENNPNNVNPWGVLPFVYVPMSDTPNYPTPSPLPDQTVELNALLSVYLTSGNMQVGQLVLKYPQDQDIQMVTHGLMTGLKLPQSTDPEAPETDAAYLSPSPNMDGHRTSIMTFLNLILDEQGIRPGSGTDLSVEKFASGLDRMISEADVQDIIEANQDIYREVEQKVYDIVKAQLESINDRQLVSDEISVIYRKPKMLITDTERLANLEKMISLGLLEEWEKFVFIDPNMSEDEAKAKLERIQSSRAESARQMAEAVTPDMEEPEEEDGDEEDDADNSR